MELGKYEKIVVISTLAEPKSIVDISMTWFGNKGRLYQPAIRKEIENSIKKGNLIRVGKKQVKANTERFIKDALEEVTLGEESKLVNQYREWLRQFYVNLGEYTQKVYLNFEIILNLVQENERLNVHKGTDLDLTLVLQLPFLLRYMDKRSPVIGNLVIQLLKLELYELTVQKLEFQFRDILKKNKWEESWIDCFRKIDELLPKLENPNVGVLGKGLNAMKTLGGK